MCYNQVGKALYNECTQPAARQLGSTWRMHFGSGPVNTASKAKVLLVAASFFTFCSTGLSFVCYSELCCNVCVFCTIAVHHCRRLLP